MRPSAAFHPPVYGYIDGGKEAESTAVANEVAFSRVLFSPKIGSGITRPEIHATVLGQRISMPVIIAPTGLHSDRASGRGDGSGACRCGRRRFRSQ